MSAVRAFRVQAASAIPKGTMKAVTAPSFGDINVLSLSDSVPVPKLERGSKEMLVSVQSVSLSPSDYRTLSGACDLVKKPRSFPFIPGGDLCGEVVALDEDDHQAKAKFKVGDSVICTWSMFGEGALAEYALVSSNMAVARPEGVSPVEGAALANTAPYACLALKTAQVKPGDRVLILGGSGGMGTLLLQLVRDAGASYVACTTTDKSLAESLSADKVINYQQQNWWELEECISEPFDVIIDCAEGSVAWQRAIESKILRPGSEGGRFVAVVLNTWDINIHSAFDMMGFMVPPIWRSMWTSFVPWVPTYSVHLDSPDYESLAKATFQVQQKKLRIIVDPQGPFAFTTAGVRDAFRKHIERRGHGKIVINVRN